MAKREIYLQRQRFTVQGDKNVSLEFEVDEDTVTLFNERGGTDFCFKHNNTKAVLEYWREVLKCMDIAVVHALGELDKKRVITNAKIKK